MNESVRSGINFPEWLPAWLESVWDLLATYPFILILVIIATGLCLAFLVRRFIRKLHSHAGRIKSLALQGSCLLQT